MNTPAPNPCFMMLYPPNPYQGMDSMNRLLMTFRLLSTMEDYGAARKVMAQLMPSLRCTLDNKGVTAWSTFSGNKPLMLSLNLRNCPGLM